MKLNQVLRLVLVNAVVFFALIVVLEVSVRLLVPEIQPTGTDSSLISRSRFGVSSAAAPSSSGYTNGVYREVDARGFWKYGSVDPALPKWLILGDSATMGIGVEADSTFAGRLSAMQDTLEVINPSVMGLASDDYLAIFESLVDEYEVQRVTLFWCLNDVMGGFGLESDFGNTLVQKSAVMIFVRRHVRLYTWAKEQFFDRPRVYFEHDSALYGEHSPYLESSAEHLKHIFSIARSRSIEAELVILPYEYGIRIGNDQPGNSLVSRLGPTTVAVLDLMKHIPDNIDQQALFLYGDGIHLSSQGHGFVAELVSELL